MEMNYSSSENESQEGETMQSSSPTNGLDCDSDENSSGDVDRVQIRKELTAMSFEDLMKLKEKLGSKVYYEALFGTKSSKNEKEKNSFKRLNKNRPREESSKRPVKYLGAEHRIKGNKLTTETRDPRFDGNCGELNTTIFKDNYSFVTDIREKELKELKRKLNLTAVAEEKIKIKFLIQRLDNQIREEKKRKTKIEMYNEELTEIKKAKEEGKTPHYSTKKELRTKELVKQYEELKKTGKLEKHLQKRRKKNSAKDRKKIKMN